jgi:phosphoribosylaminoimidazolecarboxamide formyltransferase/IMP cyclohydrolase
MPATKTIKNALISVFYKDGLEPIVKELNSLGVTIYSTGGTQKHIEDLGIEVKAVEHLTSYPSILGGRVKTLHPKVFGGILARRELKEDLDQIEEYDIPEFDLVIVDLYPFEETVVAGGSEQEVIEKIDIGGISLIRAASKNFKDVWIISSREQYAKSLSLLQEQKGKTELEQRKDFAKAAFDLSSHYDTAIYQYFLGNEEAAGVKVSQRNSHSLRYGENPHQKGQFVGDLEQMFTKLNGKELSYNNLLDVDAAVNLMADYQNEPVTFAILKHNNACGLATRETVLEAYEDALAGDPVSAFGGILICNASIEKACAEKIHALFCEVVIAPDYSDEALEILRAKKNRIILKQNELALPKKQIRSALNGYLVQDKDDSTEKATDFEVVTKAKPTEAELADLEFAAKLVKNTKSNAIVLAKGKQLLASGTGQTSRVDALQQAIAKAKHFNFDLNGAVMASDAFFPFPDCVEIANQAGINCVIQPGGSIKDKLSIDFCDQHEMAMVFTGVRHFKH